MDRRALAESSSESAYCASKAAARAFTDSVRSELVREGSPVRVCSVQLPAVNTPQPAEHLQRHGRDTLFESLAGDRGAQVV
jgi:NAD(P)-dependent dehydrogenase (short-subunit alcohol dehydrogenase family)